MQRLYQDTGKRVRLKPWESVITYEQTDTQIKVVIETYDVQELVREDRYKRGGKRGLFFTNESGRWVEALDVVQWDDSFEPFVFEKVGRRKTADEQIEQREWEKDCYRPGSKMTPLDSYTRVLDPFIRSTAKMERHF